MTEATVRDVNDIGFDLFERFVPEPQSIQYSGGKVFGYRIRYLDKLGEELFAFFGFKIEGNSEFVGVVIVAMIVVCR